MCALQRVVEFFFINLLWRGVSVDAMKSYDVQTRLPCDNLVSITSNFKSVGLANL